MNKRDIFISEGNRPIWQRLVAATFFTVAVICLLIFFDVFNLQVGNREIRRGGALFEIFVLCLAQGIGFSVVRDYHFNFLEKKYKINYCIGPMHFGKWKNFRNLEYISVFKKKTYYEINLWYNKNKRFNITNNTNADNALSAGKEIARKLQLDMIDATDPHNTKWIVL